MLTPVKLPRRLPNREPVRSDPPSEADWLRRAIRHCEHHGVHAHETPDDASFDAYARRDEIVTHVVFVAAGRPDATAGWLPEHLRGVPLAELRQLLTAFYHAWM